MEIYGKYGTLREAREGCAEFERSHGGKFCGIYKGHREYMVGIIDPWARVSDSTVGETTVNASKRARKGSAR